jgi:uncharacterized repeat protein (TIGR03806 family)
MGRAFLGFMLIIMVISCQSNDQSEVTLNLNKIPYAQLSDYNFFEGDLKSLTPNEGIIPYDVITPLFSDYALKARFVYMGGQVAQMEDDGTVQFPDGAVLIKNFYYLEDFRDQSSKSDMIETRLLIKKEGKWNAYTYVWNDKDTDANLTNVGAYEDVSWIDNQGSLQKINYTIPNKNQCKGCHNVADQLLPIGPKFKNLNYTFTYDSGPQNQVDYWIQHGILNPNNSVNSFTQVAWDDSSRPIDARALSYLEMNCGHCHDELGQAHTTGLFLNNDFESLTQLGVCKTPVAAGKGSGGRLVGVMPGHADQSILYFRMESNDPGVMMPELGRTVAHAEGLKLIKEWIESIDGSCDLKKI